MWLYKLQVSSYPYSFLDEFHLRAVLRESHISADRICWEFEEQILYYVLDEGYLLNDVAVDYVEGDVCYHGCFGVDW